MKELEIAEIAVAALEERKGIDIKLLKVTDLTVLADYFVIASGTSSTHVRTLAEEVEHKLSEKGIKPSRVEGAKVKDWILLDYGVLIVHVFHPEAREFYSLERLWADAKQVDIG